MRRDGTVRCFFFGCGSSEGFDLCFDRTGTAVVVQVVARGKSGAGSLGTGIDGGQAAEVGFRAVNPITQGRVALIIAWTAGNVKWPKVRFWVQYHMGGNATMRCHCRCCEKSQAKGTNV